ARARVVKPSGSVRRVQAPTAAQRRFSTGSRRARWRRAFVKVWGSSVMGVRGVLAERRGTPFAPGSRVVPGRPARAFRVALEGPTMSRHVDMRPEDAGLVNPQGIQPGPQSPLGQDPT